MRSETSRRPRRLARDPPLSERCVRGAFGGIASVLWKHGDYVSIAGFLSDEQAKAIFGKWKAPGGAESPDPRPSGGT
jgi:hypothetical protein